MNVGKVEKWLEAKLEPWTPENCIEAGYDPVCAECEQIDAREPLYPRDPDEPHPLLAGLAMVALVVLFLMAIGWLLSDQIEVALTFWGVS